MLESWKQGSLVLRALLEKVPHDRRGVTAVEYGVLAALIVVVCITAITNLGQFVFVNLYQEIANAVGTATR